MSGLLDRYDANGNRQIDDPELNQAVRDKLAGDLSAEQFQTIKAGYLGSPDGSQTSDAPTYDEVLDAIERMNSGGDISRSEVENMADEYNDRPEQQAELSDPPGESSQSPTVGGAEANTGGTGIDTRTLAMGAIAVAVLYKVIQ